MKWKLIHVYETTKHRARVAWYVFKACWALVKRAIRHDLSKYSKYEAPYFEKSLPALRGLEYASKEYMAAIESLGPALHHHYRSNSHHPEHYDGVDGMSPLDLIEMLCDWKAATKRHATGNFGKSLEVNETRFSYDGLRTHTFKNAAREIGL
jgi:hypothetical protein